MLQVLLLYSKLRAALHKALLQMQAQRILFSHVSSKSQITHATLKIQELQTTSQVILHPRIIYAKPADEVGCNKAHQRQVNLAGRESRLRATGGTGESRGSPDVTTLCITCVIPEIYSFDSFSVCHSGFVIAKNLSGYMPELYLLVMALCNFGSLRKMKMSWP